MVEEKSYDALSIVASINKSIEKSNSSDYYVGITNDLMRRLDEHNVKPRDCVAILKAKDISEARIAERVLTAVSGFKGDSGGGKDGSIYVYCYRITDSTVQ
jgi:hypothetical protein